MRMLLVEDEKKVSELVARALRAERYAVDVADDGTRGWELASAFDYDLIILDLMLPGIPGEELLRRIRRKNQQVPILILTARDATEEKVQNFEAGADDYLTKPFAFAELIMRVKALLRRGPVDALERAAGGGPRGRSLLAAGAPRRQAHRADAQGIRAARVPGRQSRAACSRAP